MKPLSLFQSRQQLRNRASLHVWNSNQWMQRKWWKSESRFVTSCGLKSFKDQWEWSSILARLQWHVVNVLVSQSPWERDHMKPNSSPLMRQDGQATIREVLLKKINLNFIIPLGLATPLIGHTLRKGSLMTPWRRHLPRSECADSAGQVARILPTSPQQPVGKSKTREEPSTFYRYCLDSDSNNFAVEGYHWDNQTIWVWTVYWMMWRNMLILGVFTAW